MAEWPWRDDGVTMTTICPVCQRPFMPVGRQQVCSAACRQARWRQRHPRPLPMLPAQRPKAETVYQCPTCETRYLGEQWCPACGVFCRRLSAGGDCPHCGEPVALVDLVPELLEGGETGRRPRR
jgi:hypothetical protein